MLIETTLRLLGFALGAALNLFLAVVLARKRKPGLGEQLLLASLTSAGVWQASHAMAIFYQASTGRLSGVLMTALNLLALLGMVAAPALLVHLGMVWAGAHRWASLPAAGVVLAAFWMVMTRSTQDYAVWLGLGLAAAGGLCLYAARRQEERSFRYFLLAFGAALAAIPGAAAIAGTGSALLAWVSLAPPLCLAYFVYRCHLFGLSISRRVVFALSLGVVFALYLLLVRRAAGFAEEEFEVFGPLTELALVLAAALVWLPLYGWMTRFLSQRMQLYADFSKRATEQAARILDLESRLRYLAGEVGRSFRLRRVLLITSREPRRRGEFGPQPENVPAGSEETFRQIESLVLQRRADLVRAGNANPPELGKLVSELAFDYLFPLWYEDHLNGLLLLDTSPRLYLEENEAIVLGLSRQISDSIETCRLIEEKIGLEKTLTHQQHLAGLGKVAATIAHEIRNPLSSIKTLAQLLLEDPEVRQRYSRDLGYLVGEIDRLNRSVQQLLNFSRPAPEVEVEVDVTALLEATAGVLAREHAGGHLRIEQRIAPHLRLKRANPEMVQQVVLNLALNAIQASESSGAVRVEAVGEPAGSVCITVSDQGPGIPAGIGEKIFEPFFTTKQRGTGLGLAIVKKNVGQLRGQIRVESPIETGRGTRVAVTLPVE